MFFYYSVVIVVRVDHVVGLVHVEFVNELLPADLLEMGGLLQLLDGPHEPIVDQGRQVTAGVAFGPLCYLLKVCLFQGVLFTGVQLKDVFSVL